MELVLYLLVVALGGLVDVYTLLAIEGMGVSLLAAKCWSSLILYVFNFALRKYLVFPERSQKKLVG